ncbi:hypothetical protein SAMN05216452_2421 [Nitratireductor aquibiodomus]|uniref:Glyoxylase, beta-lactamase superfamily II n=1 Tax=Nitratireductor aquibiodomus TaxID=204799 RepID=A0A1H4KSS8_9HYPH|nr:hypothetical protein [Nitratireductor aquibiodomus]SEB60962.1 hypothetical protein SAMN05216452_2421 [Nitratireductor aquibiodomus]
MAGNISKLARLEDIHIIRAGKLNCFALRLQTGGLCLYSPIAGQERVQREALEQLGGVSVLLAPNHYHNKGLAGHAEAFRNATVACSASAKPRLEKVTGLTYEPLQKLETALQKGHTLLEPQGLKTGEVWVEIQNNSDTIWIVADAFMSESRSSDGFGDTPARSGSFPRYGVDDAKLFANWVEQRLAIASPTILLPCHGGPVKSPHLGPMLSTLNTKMLGSR